MNCTFGPRARGWGPSCAVSALQRMSIVGHAQGSTRTETAYRYDRRSHSRWPDRHRRSQRYPTVSTQQSGISSKRISTDGQGSERPPKLFSGNLEKLREATTRDRTVARSSLIQNHDIRPNRSGHHELETLGALPNPARQMVFTPSRCPPEHRKAHREGAPVMI